jgi:hypothetical protein
MEKKKSVRYIINKYRKLRVVYCIINQYRKLRVGYSWVSKSVFWRNKFAERRFVFYSIILITDITKVTLLES